MNRDDNNRMRFGRGRPPCYSIGTVVVVVARKAQLRNARGDFDNSDVAAVCFNNMTTTLINEEGPASAKPENVINRKPLGQFRTECLQETGLKIMQFNTACTDVFLESNAARANFR